MKKGFTIIELVSVIALLSITAVILIPAFNNTIKESRADELEDVRENIVKSAEVYLNSDCGLNNYNLLNNNGNIRIYLNEINNCGLIDKKIYNPMNGEYFNISNEYVDVYIDDMGMISYNLSF